VECVHADRCGGCPIIALAYGEQLAMKRGRVVQSVSRYPALELVYTEPVQPAEPVLGYRTRAKLIVSPATPGAPGGRSRVGLFAKGGGHQVVDIPSCRVLSPALARVTDALRARISNDEVVAGPLAPYDAAGAGALRALDLREVCDAESVSRVLVTLVVQRSRATDPQALEPLRAVARDLMVELPEIAGVAVNFHDGDAPQILGNETVLLHGQSQIPDRLGTSTHLATFGSFVQAHRGQAERVHTMVAEALGVARAKADGKPLRVLDLYGGSGAIALGLAAAGAHVHLIESFAPAAAHAQEAARRTR
jgi:23S rRNA (uracil1939-C5)-methyltransferase